VDRYLCRCRGIVVLLSCRLSHELVRAALLDRKSPLEIREILDLLSPGFLQSHVACRSPGSTGNSPIFERRSVRRRLLTLSACRQVKMMSTGPGSTADRTAQNDSEGFVSRYNKYASLSLKRQRELLPIYRHRIPSQSAT
jgi:hypothetical protein